MPEPHDLQAAADGIADTLLSGLTGLALAEALRTRFARATRAEFAFGAAMAFSVMEADRIGLVAELLAAETKLAAIEPRAEAA